MLWLLYLYTVIDNLKCTLAGSIGISLCALTLGNIIWLCHGAQSWDKPHEITDKQSTRLVTSKWVKWSLFIIVLSSILQILTPNSKGIAVLAGGAFAQSVVQSEEAKEVGGKVLTLLNQQLDEHIKQPAKE